MALNREYPSDRERREPRASERARTAANPNARFMRDQRGMMIRNPKDLPGRPAPRPQGPVQPVADKLIPGINRVVANRTQRFMANHPNIDPAKLQNRIAKWTAGSTMRHNMRYAANQMKDLKSAPVAPPQNKIGLGVNRSLSRMPSMGGPGLKGRGAL